MLYRALVAVFANFCTSEVCSWVHICVYLGSSAFLCYQYYRYIPYYNAFLSVFIGTLFFVYFWVSFNALLMKIFETRGQLIIVLVGLPLVLVVVRNIRARRINSLLETPPDKIQNDIDVLLALPYLYFRR